MKKFQNKYRIPSARLQNWDYGNNGAYFITICVDKMECLFGDVISVAVCDADVSHTNVETRFIASQINAMDKKCEMQLNELGKIAHEIWQEIPNKFPFVELGNFVIMPNHMHGILIVNKSIETRLIASVHSHPNANPNAHPNANPNANPDANENPNADDNDKGGFAGNNSPMLQENISRIIRWYKGRCSFEMRKIHADFTWLPRFYDHIIRDSRAFETIQNYIEENPSKWSKDKFHK